jgi:ATP/maltotriose-dependent transcriptional regulator MalT
LLTREDPAGVQAVTKALEIERRIGFLRAAGYSLEALAGERRRKADFVNARRLLEESLATMKEVGDTPGIVAISIDLGNVSLNTGDPKSGRRYYREALAGAREISDRRGTAMALGNVALIDELEGDLGTGRARLEEALQLKREIGDPNSLAYTLGKLAEANLAAGDWQSARRWADEQKSVLRSAKLWGPRDELIYAKLAIEEGRPADAEATMSALAAQSPLPNPGAEAWRVLAQSRLERGDIRRAREAADQAVRLAHKSPNRADYGIPADLISARVAAMEGRGADAKEKMQRLLDEATRLGNVALQLEIRLWIGLTDRAAGIREAPGELDQLRKDATARGFGLIAKRATAGL